MNNTKLVGANLLGAGLILLASLSNPAQAKLYKWVDDNGTTHYGETIPPEYANKNNVLLNDKGQVTKRNEKATEEQKRAVEEAAAKKRIAEIELQEQRRKDMSLLNTYSSEQEIELARTRNLQQAETRVSSIKVMKKTAEANLSRFQVEADDKVKAGKPVHASLQADLTESKARLEKLTRDLTAAEQKAASLNANYDAEKKRYRELKGNAER